ncbi:hypothetical protein PIB30_050400 [Stylosanthes scabra]|uniref:Uncharacterized protein n=1 Tax=Stylosanthes scabra TaxID=79078 RepID=A0ABU6VJK0_9FABA|nr:hypothetical protein [Stylosanthes scabra]
MKMVVAQRPPPEPPNFTSDGDDKQRSLAHEIDGTSLGDGDERLAARTPVAIVGEGTTSMLGGWRITQAVRRAMLLNPPSLMAAVFPWDRAAQTELTTDRRDGDGGMVQWRSPSLSFFGHVGNEGRRLPSIALSPTAMLRGAPRAMNQERDGYGYGYGYDYGWWQHMGNGGRAKTR